jgi:hypothetical protein
MRSFFVILLVAVFFAACRPSNSTPDDLRVRIDSIARRVEVLRQAKFERPVEGRYLARQDLLRIYDSVSFEEPDPADSSWDRMLWSLGFVDTMGALDNAADSVDQSSILAFYSRGVLWVVDDLSDSAIGDSGVSELDVTIAHELVHALQDQRWDLAKLYREHRGMDGRLSLQYLLEGEARLVETLYSRKLADSIKALSLFPQLPLEHFRDSLRHGEGLDPEMITLPTFHPYEQGARAIAWRWAHGGWAAVDEWFRTVPPTTCYLHPDDSCQIHGVLRASGMVAMPQGWKPLHVGTVGEHYMNILFSLWRASDEWIPAGALKSGHILHEPWRDPGPDGAVEGWRSDHFEVWRDDTGNLALAWRTSWRDTVAAERFLQAYQRLLVKKMRDDRVVRRKNGLALFHDQESKVWDRIERFGNEVWIAEGMVSREPFRFQPLSSRAGASGVPSSRR